MDEDVPRFSDSITEAVEEVADCPGSGLTGQLTDFPVFFSSSPPSFSPNKANWNGEGHLIRSFPVEQPLLASYQYSPEVQKAIESILYIADHIKKEDDDNNVRDPVLAFNLSLFNLFLLFFPPYPRSKNPCFFFVCVNSSYPTILLFPALNGTIGAVIFIDSSSSPFQSSISLYFFLSFFSFFLSLTPSLIDRRFHCFVNVRSLKTGNMLLWYWIDSFCGFLRLPVWLEHVGSFFKLLLYTINEFQLIHNYHKSADDLSFSSSSLNPHSTNLSTFYLSTSLSIPCFLIHPLQIHLFPPYFLPFTYSKENKQ